MLRMQRKDTGAIRQTPVQGDQPVSDYNRINAVVKIPAEQLGSGKMRSVEWELRLEAHT